MDGSNIISRWDLMPVRWLACLSADGLVCHDFITGRDVTLQCSYRSTFFFVKKKDMVTWTWTNIWLPFLRENLIKNTHPPIPWSANRVLSYIYNKKSSPCHFKTCLLHTAPAWIIGYKEIRKEGGNWTKLTKKIMDLG